MSLIYAREKYLIFEGLPSDALSFVEHIREVFDESGFEMSKILNDFVFNLEVSLQNAGVLDENFEKIGEMRNV